MTGIQWTDETWNPVIGCRRVSEGCRNCYAEKRARRIVACQRGLGNRHDYEDVVKMDDVGKPRPRWNGSAKFLRRRLDEPLRWRKPRKVFVNSMSDLFHEDISFEQIGAVFGVMAASPDHTFQILTKRPERAREFFEWLDEERMRERGIAQAPNRVTTLIDHAHDKLPDGVGTPKATLRKARIVARRKGDDTADAWPLPNVWLGTSCEDQETADERIPQLLQCPAAVRFVSAEPLLAAVDIRRRWIDDSWTTTHGNQLDWVIVGGESGPDARVCELGWVTDIVEQCSDASVPVFVKQLGSRPLARLRGASAALCGPSSWIPPYSHPKGGDPDEWPERLRVREFPR